jgi:predicted chitinase
LVGAARPDGARRHALDVAADKGNVVEATRIINGGKIGLKERLAYYAVATKVLA